MSRRFGLILACLHRSNRKFQHLAGCSWVGRGEVNSGDTAAEGFIRAHIYQVDILAGKGCKIHDDVEAFSEAWDDAPVRDVIEASTKPVVVSIPGKTGATAQGEQSIAMMVKRAIGIELKG